MNKKYVTEITFGYEK